MFSFSLEIGTTILAAIAIVSLVAFLISKKKLNNSNFDIDECEFGLNGGSIRLVCNNNHRQIAYKLWVDINTRTFAVKIDLEKDIIRAINDSYHQCFIDTRELLKEFPVSKLKNNNDLVKLIIRFLNEVLRPYLTKWGVKFSRWYDLEMTKEENKNLSPVEIQRKFAQYDELAAELLEINTKVLAYREFLEKVAFNAKK